MWKRVALVIIGLLVLSAGSFFLYTYFQAMKAIHDSRNWPTTKGTVILSEIRTRESKVQSQKSSTRRMESYSLILYRYNVGYTVAGQRSAEAVKRQSALTSSAITLYGADAPELAAKYPVGKEVTVYYNPEFPSQTMLEEENYRINSELIFGLLFALSGLLVILVQTGVLSKRKR